MYLCLESLVHFPSFFKIRESHYNIPGVIEHFKRHLIHLLRIWKQLLVFQPYSLVKKKFTRKLLQIASISLFRFKSVGMVKSAHVQNAI